MKVCKREDKQLRVGDINFIYSTRHPLDECEIMPPRAHHNTSTEAWRQHAFFFPQQDGSMDGFISLVRSVHATYCQARTRNRTQMQRLPLKDFIVTGNCPLIAVIK